MLLRLGVHAIAVANILRLHRASPTSSGMRCSAVRVAGLSAAFLIIVLAWIGPEAVSAQPHLCNGTGRRFCAKAHLVKECPRACWPEVSLMHHALHVYFCCSCRYLQPVNTELAYVCFAILTDVERLSWIFITFDVKCYASGMYQRCEGRRLYGYRRCESARRATCRDYKV